MILNVDEAVSRAISGPVFLALTIWREARGASVQAQVAVGYSIMNRVERPSWWGKSLDDVLFKKWQYSSIAAPGDPQLILYPRFSDPSWLEALGVARAVIGKTEPNPAPGADSYYDDSIAAPKWATPDKIVAKIGKLNFFDVDGDHEAISIIAAAPPGDSFEQTLRAWLGAA
jgi:spore germination cell wall hydrolase CwlJ-like protein